MYSLKFTGILRRSLAFLLDLLIVFLIMYLLSSFLKLFFLIFGGVKGTDYFEEHVLIIRSITFFVVSLIYFSYFLSTSLSSSIGQYLLKMKVVDQEENHISLLRSIGRYFATYLSFLTLLLGLIMAFYNPNRQTLHDKICKTYVIDR